MDSLTRSGKKMLRNLNKKFGNNPSELHFSVTTPSKARKGKLFEDCESETTDNHSLADDSINSGMHRSPQESSSGALSCQSGPLDVGFSYLPHQIKRKILSKPLSFTLMVAGSSGLGKSTLVNSLFRSDIYSDKYPGPTERSSSTVSVESTSVELTENNVSLNVTIVDTPGFAMGLDHSSCWKPLINYLKAQHCEYLRGEIKFDHDIQDSRVHCCLYFIPPTGHRLEQLDIECMKQLCKHVNLIPVIGKADTMTAEEVKHFKGRVREDLTNHKINVYSFDMLEDMSMNGLEDFEFPFAVAGSNYVKELPDGRRIRAREYTWGTFEIDNPAHCDTSILRNLLVKNFMYDLISSTHSIHYENYRRDCLSKGVVTAPAFKHKERLNDSEYTFVTDFTLMRAINSNDD